MNRAGRFSLFALAVSISSAFVIYSGKSTDDAEADVGPLQAQPATPRGENESPENDPDPLEGLDEAEIAAHVRERGKRRAATITAAAAREDEDPEWAPATEQQIIERFAREAPPSFALVSTTCKTSLCIAEVETPSREQSVGQMAWHRFFGFSRTYVHHRGEQGDAFRTLVFLARAGHSLPK